MIGIDEKIHSISSINEMAEFINSNADALKSAEILDKESTSLLKGFYSNLRKEPTDSETEKLFSEIHRLVSIKAYEAAQSLFLSCLRHAATFYYSLLDSELLIRQDKHLKKCYLAAMWLSIANHCQMIVRRAYV
jgi:hypothetical protein